MKMKIAYCIPALYYPSGMERVLTMKANYLARQGHEIHIIITDGGDKKPYFPLDESVKVHQLNIDFEEPYKHFLLCRLWLYRQRMYKLKERLSVCLSHIQPDITISLLRRDINIIDRMKDGSIKIGEIHFDRLHYRYFNARWLPSVLNSYIQRRWMGNLVRELRKLSKFVVLTYEDLAYWTELDNVMVIPNPASFFPDRVSDCRNKQVIAVGRYVEQKGFDRLIPAWRQVIDRHPDWVLKIYGDGRLRNQLQHQIEKLRLSEHCILEKPVSDIITKYQESSIFVLSSRFEGVSLVMMEAMACGLPVVAYACHCGPRDVISEEVDGLLVPEGDIDGLAEAMSRLIEDEGLRMEMGKNARVKAEKYDIDSIGKQWIDLFESLLEERRKRI